VWLSLSLTTPTPSLLFPSLLTPRSNHGKHFNVYFFFVLLFFSFFTFCFWKMVCG